MVTNLDASIYAQLKVPSVTNPNQLETLSFDWILCDVPCGGDGMMRKNLGIWKTWQPMDGNGLHELQLHILQRAMKMLAPQGRVVYSKCSLNPVENEADIACALRSEEQPRFASCGDVAGRWPPEDVGKLGLPRCLRIYPHLQDTGGFFVAVLERTKTKKEAVEAPSRN
ncbi:S-adenosyl-L-methionine-dependent methyltransferase [Mycena galopus ATCC 62051]|nr:S-adenosyl-L-methionine-dependent methyltransferase [Mycena galopus ATCC 62051]KAF8212798.1 S-adenosyl-L-methionine-dependent methyltransferase [Mycena galopus ATCC 62051]